MYSQTPEPNQPKPQTSSNFIPSDGQEFIFTKESIASRDYYSFLQNFALNPKIEKKDIQNQFGGITFTFEHDNSKTEIWEETDIRNHIVTLDSACPCWLFFGKLELENILPILACIAPEISSFRRSHSKQTIISIPDDVVRPVFGRWMVTALKIGEWAELPEITVKKRLHEWMKMLLHPEVEKDFAQKFL